MTFGLTIEKLMLIAVIAALIIGPERLPAAAEALARLTRRARAWGRTAQERLRDELGPEVDDVDWQRLDPRRYDPRRIVREALLAPPMPPAPASAPASALPPGPPPGPAPALPTPPPPPRGDSGDGISAE